MHGEPCSSGVGVGRQARRVPRTVHRSGNGRMVARGLTGRDPRTANLWTLHGPASQPPRRGSQAVPGSRCTGTKMVRWPGQCTVVWGEVSAAETDLGDRPGVTAGANRLDEFSSLRQSRRRSRPARPRPTPAHWLDVGSGLTPSGFVCPDVLCRFRSIRSFL